MFFISRRCSPRGTQLPIREPAQTKARCGAEHACGLCLCVLDSERPPRWRFAPLRRPGGRGVDERRAQTFAMRRPSSRRSSSCGVWRDNTRSTAGRSSRSSSSVSSPTRSRRSISSKAAVMNKRLRPASPLGRHSWPTFTTWSRWFTVVTCACREHFVHAIFGPRFYGVHHRLQAVTERGEFVVDADRHLGGDPAFE